MDFGLLLYFSLFFFYCFLLFFFFIVFFLKFFSSKKSSPILSSQVLLRLHNLSKKNNLVHLHCDGINQQHPYKSFEIYDNNNVQKRRMNKIPSCFDNLKVINLFSRILTFFSKQCFYLVFFPQGMDSNTLNQALGKKTQVFNEIKTYRQKGFFLLFKMVIQN